MRLQVLGAGIIIMVAGGSLGAIGFSEFITCSSSFSCSSSVLATTVVLGEAVVFIGVVVTIIGVILAVARHAEDESGSTIASPTRVETSQSRRLMNPYQYTDGSI